MGAEINNRENKKTSKDLETRKKVLKNIIEELHQGKSVDEVKSKFAETFGEVDAKEIVEAEQELIMSGVAPEEIQSLCDVHAEVFKGSINDIHHPTELKHVTGHPVRTMFLENRATETLLNEEIEGNLNKYISKGKEKDYEALLEGLKKLQGIDIHYKKKENLFFPYMEKYGFQAPPQVMWGVDDEIRSEIKKAYQHVSKTNRIDDTLKDEILTVITRVNEMIFKEENIMSPMLTDNLTQDEWKMIADDSSEFGYFLIKTPSAWEPQLEYKYAFSKDEEEEVPQGTISLPTGKFTAEELTTVLNSLPFDITFVDKNDRVKYFSEAKERIFPRTRTIIGREVANCHPPASVHIVEGIVADFKSGAKDHEDFWIKMAGKYIHIRYFALKDEKGEYLGTVEVTQNIGPIQEITGEKRLVSLETKDNIK